MEEAGFSVVAGSEAPVYSEAQATLMHDDTLPTTSTTTAATQGDDDQHDVNPDYTKGVDKPKDIAGNATSATETATSRTSKPSLIEDTSNSKSCPSNDRNRENPQSTKKKNSATSKTMSSTRRSRVKRKREEASNITGTMSAWHMDIAETSFYLFHYAVNFSMSKCCVCAQDSKHDTSNLHVMEGLKDITTLRRT